MEDMKWLIRKWGLFLFILLVVAIVGCLALKGLEPNERKTVEEIWEPPVAISSKELKTVINAEAEMTEQLEKGYNLPVEDREEKEAKEQCKKVMEYVSDIYEQADKGKSLNVILSDKTILEMQNKVRELGYPVAAAVTYSNMKNQEGVERFLGKCKEGKSGSVVIYEVYSDGGIGRIKFIFDGTDMYVVSARGIWNSDNQPGIAHLSRTRIKEWEYTDKGWFCYELCVPEPPEVTEIVDGSNMIRVRPITEEQREMSERCVRGLGYQGNNLLCSNWNINHMEELDYNGMFEYLYGMKYQEKFNSEDYPNGIPKEKFENLIMEYLPITAEQIREYAVFDEENQTYAWARVCLKIHSRDLHAPLRGIFAPNSVDAAHCASFIRGKSPTKWDAQLTESNFQTHPRLGCLNYAPIFLGTSLPEVTDIKENKGGTITLTVEAVCEMVICDDAVITHELTVRFAEDGSFQYLGNEILNGGMEKIPAYQYRIHMEQP